VDEPGASPRVRDQPPLPWVGDGESLSTRCGPYLAQPGRWSGRPRRPPGGRRVARWHGHPVPAAGPHLVGSLRRPETKAAPTKRARMLPTRGAALWWGWLGRLPVLVRRRRTEPDSAAPSSRIPMDGSPGSCGAGRLRCHWLPLGLDSPSRRYRRDHKGLSHCGLKIHSAEIATRSGRSQPTSTHVLGHQLA